MPPLYARIIDRLRRRFYDFAAANGANTAIEFAFTVPIFIALAIGILYVGVTYLAKEHLETIAENVAYQIEIQNPAVQNLTRTQFQNYICNNLSGVFDCTKVFIDLAYTPTPTYDPYSKMTTVNGVPTFNGAYTTMTSGQTGNWTLSLMYLWPTIKLPFGINFGNQADGSLLIMSVQVFAIEHP